jgi:probable F420-dependent oxidoreductase
MQLSKIGIWTSYRQIGAANAAVAARLAEELGVVFWLGGSPRLPDLRPLLEATGRLIVATGIVNVWQNDPAELAGQFAQLDAEFPGRILVGIGIGHPEATSDYTRPLTTMCAFLDGLDGATPPLPAARRCLAALGPKMLDLAAERSAGTHTYFVPVEHTRATRDRLGPDALVATELACVLDDNDERARATARGYAALYLGLRNYTGNLLRHGFTEEDIAGGGSDRLIDAIVPHGGPERIAAVARDHLGAGADHVCLQPVGVEGVPQEQWAALAAALE